MSGQKEFVSLPLTKAMSFIQSSPKRAHYYSPFTFGVLEKTREEGGGVWATDQNFSQHYISDFLFYFPSTVSVGVK